MRQTLRKQKGVTLVGLIFVGMVLVMVSVLGMKVAPEVLDYYTTLGNVKATAADPMLRGVGVPQIRAAYLKRLQVAGGGPVGPDDLDVSKEGGEVVISFAYAKKIHLFRNVSLLIDFEGSSSATAATAAAE